MNRFPKYFSANRQSLSLLPADYSPYTAQVSLDQSFSFTPPEYPPAPQVSVFPGCFHYIHLREYYQAFWSLPPWSSPRLREFDSWIIEKYLAGRILGTLEQLLIEHGPARFIGKMAVTKEGEAADIKQAFSLSWFFFKET